MRNFVKFFSIFLLLVHNVRSSTATTANQPGNQFVHEKEFEPSKIINTSTGSEEQDHFPVMNEYKSDYQSYLPQQASPSISPSPSQSSPLTASLGSFTNPFFSNYFRNTLSNSQNSFNPFLNAFPRLNRFYNNFYGYNSSPNPFYVPYPMWLVPATDYLYSPLNPFFSQSSSPAFPQSTAAPSLNDFEDTVMSRSNMRRPTSSYRNSPIYYIRVPPTPYMFIPGFGYMSQPPTFTPNISPLMQYNALSLQSPSPASSSLSPHMNPIINLPVNFISNGKPTGIYQLDGSGLSPSPSSSLSSSAPLATPFASSYHFTSRPYRPSAAAAAYLDQSFAAADSKVTHLKQPFIFNGRPEEIYFLQNSYTPPPPPPLSSVRYYQQPFQSFY